MGMNVCNIRMVPTEAKILRGNEGWTVSGHSFIVENELIKYLVENNVDILERINESADSGKSYLVNKGIEMLVGLEGEYINLIQLRINLSWIKTGLQEAYGLISLISQICPVNDWINNDSGEAINDCEAFIKRHMNYWAERYFIFKKTYPDSKGERLTETEFYDYYPKRKRKILRYKRNLSEYRVIDL